MFLIRSEKIEIFFTFIIVIIVKLFSFINSINRINGSFAESHKKISDTLLAMGGSDYATYVCAGIWYLSAIFIPLNRFELSFYSEFLVKQRFSNKSQIKTKKFKDFTIFFNAPSLNFSFILPGITPDVNLTSRRLSHDTSTL